MSGAFVRRKWITDNHELIFSISIGLCQNIPLIWTIKINLFAFVDISSTFSMYPLFSSTTTNQID